MQVLSVGCWLGLLAGWLLAGRAGAQPAPTARWVGTLSTVGYDTYSYVALDQAGNAYSAGYAQAGSGANYQLYLAKHDAQGRQLWRRQFVGTNGAVTPMGVQVDSVGNVWVNGFFGRHLSFVSGVLPSVAFDGVTLTAASASGDNDLFLVKLSPAGTVLWAQQSSRPPAAAGGSPTASALAVDPGGNAYLLGEGSAGLRLGANSPALSRATSFVVKYSPQGAVQWLKELGHGSGQPGSLAADAAGTCYLLNYTREPVAMGATSIPGAAGYLAGLDPQGQVLWARPVPLGATGSPVHLAATPGGELRLTVPLREPATLGGQTFVPRGEDVLCLGFTRQGLYEWGTQLASPRLAAASGVAAGPDGRSYVLLSMLGMQTPTQAGGDPAGQRYFLVALAAAGALRWWRTFPERLWPWALAAAAPDDLRLVGMTGQPLDLDGLSLTCEGPADGLVARLTLAATVPPGTTTTPATLPTDNPAVNSVFLPNVLTPDGDGLNDAFAPRHLPAGPWQLRVYARWGQLLYQADDYQLNWSAGGLAAGTYYYRLTAPGQPAYQGWVEVVR